MAETRYPKSFGGLRVLVAGGGVAGLETLLALRALAGDLVDLELLSHEPRFWYRPLAVAELFEPAGAHSVELAAVAEAVAARFTLDRLASVDAGRKIVRTGLGATIHYDELVIACGSLPRRALDGAITFRGPADRETFQDLLSEVEGGRVHSIAFAVPGGVTWPLPLYELALLTAARLEGTCRVELTFITPEAAPLALFGATASDAVRAVLAERGIGLRTCCFARRYDDGQLELVPEATLRADRVVSLPRLVGSRILGIPQDDEGFIATDASGRVHGLSRVYAAGDITQFPIKQGGLAAQQADALAELIAARAGAAVEPERFRPVLRALLLTGGGPLYLRSEPHGGQGDTSAVSNEPLWWPPAKLAGRFLAPFLAGSFDELRTRRADLHGDRDRGGDARAARIRGHGEVSRDRLDAVGETAKPGACSGDDTSDPVVGDRDCERPVCHFHADGHLARVRMLGGVRERFRDDEVGSRLDGRGQTTGQVVAHDDRKWCPFRERPKRDAQAVVGEDGRVQAAGELPKLGDRLGQIVRRRLELRHRSIRRRRDMTDRKAKRKSERHESLLSAVVKVSFEPATLVVGGLDEPAA